MKNLNFIAAEQIALNLAYTQFFGENMPVGIAYTFIIDRENGQPWTDAEKATAKFISEQAIRDLKNQNLRALIVSGTVPDCAMARRFMATGSGQTSKGYNF